MIDEPSHPTLVLLSLASVSPLPFAISEPKRSPSSVPPRVDALPFRCPGDDYDLPTCAAWRASFDWGVARGVVLVTEDDERVTRAERYWADLADARAEEGDSSLLDHFDERYSARLDEQCGGLVAVEVTALMMGAKTRDPRVARLPALGKVRLVRDWMRRSTLQPSF